MIHIIGTGLSGLVGSRIVELLSDKYSFEDISRSTGTDITNKEAVRERMEKSSSKIVLHFAAKTNVDGCELDKHLGENGDAWKINVEGTENIVAACEATHKKLVYISTDFIFDGEHPSIGGYTEDDDPRPVNWYAMTKYEGEQRVEEANIPWVIARIAYPYRGVYTKNDFFRAILNGLQQGKPIRAVTDHFFCPTFIDDIAHACTVLLDTNATGIYHVTGSQALSPYEAALNIAEKFNLDTHSISKTTRAEYFKDKAPRPFDLSMNNGKIKTLGIEMKTFEEGLNAIKSQIDSVSS